MEALNRKRHGEEVLGTTLFEEKKDINLLLSVFRAIQKPCLCITRCVDDKRESPHRGRQGYRPLQRSPGADDNEAARAPVRHLQV